MLPNYEMKLLYSFSLQCRARATSCKIFIDSGEFQFRFFFDFSKSCSAAGRGCESFKSRKFGQLQKSNQRMRKREKSLISKRNDVIILRSDVEISLINRFLFLVLKYHVFSSILGVFSFCMMRSLLAVVYLCQITGYLKHSSRVKETLKTVILSSKLRFTLFWKLNMS